MENDEETEKGWGCWGSHIGKWDLCCHWWSLQVSIDTLCCSVLQCVAVCCSVLQCVAVCCSMWLSVIILHM